MDTKFLILVDKQNLHNCEGARTLSTVHSHERIPAKFIHIRYTIRLHFLFSIFVIS